MTYDQQHNSNPGSPLIEPRVRTEATGAHEQSSSRLPDAVVSEQVQRLAVCTAVGAGLWTYGLVMDTIVRPLTVGVIVPRTNVMIELVSIALSGLMFLYVRYAPHQPHTKSDAGLLYFVLNAVGVALLNSWALNPGHEAVGRLSWNTIVILVSSMIMPTTPWKMLATSIAVASMDPLAVWLAHLRGLPVPSVVNTFVLFMPNYACAVVATLPSHVLHRLSRRLRHAQEMGSYHLIRAAGAGRDGRSVARTSSPAGAQRGDQAGTAGDSSGRAPKPRLAACCAGSKRKRRPRPR